MKTTAIYPNRIRDKDLLESTVGLPEFPGSQVFHFYSKKQTLIANNYVRVVYGDHGPYVEFHPNQIRAELVNKFDNETPRDAFYIWKTLADGSGIKIYDQLRTVSHLKNPPKGGFNGNRAEGYADYKPGMIYISPRDLKIEKTISLEVGELELNTFPNRVIVAGSRKFYDYDEFSHQLLNYIQTHNLDKKNTVFISGGALSGADKLIIDFCKDREWCYHIVPAKWDELDRDDNRVKIKNDSKGRPYNSLAGYLRNEKMAYLGNYLVVFWNGVSPGTKHMLKTAEESNMKNILVVMVDTSDENF